MHFFLHFRWNSKTCFEDWVTSVSNDEEGIVNYADISPESWGWCSYVVYRATQLCYLVILIFHFYDHWFYRIVQSLHFRVVILKLYALGLTRGFIPISEFGCWRERQNENRLFFINADDLAHYNEKCWFGDCHTKSKKTFFSQLRATKNRKKATSVNCQAARGSYEGKHTIRFVTCPIFLSTNVTCSP